MFLRRLILRTDIYVQQVTYGCTHGCTYGHMCKYVRLDLRAYLQVRTARPTGLRTPEDGNFFLICTVCSTYYKETYTHEHKQPNWLSRPFWAMKIIIIRVWTCPVAAWNEQTIGRIHTNALEFAHHQSWVWSIQDWPIICLRQSRFPQPSFRPQTKG